LTDLAIIPWIRGLGEAEAVALARDIISAEVGRLGLPRDTFSMTARVKAKDGGVDGRTRFPIGIGAILPEGEQIWQIKSGVTAPSASTEFDPEKRKSLRQAIANGSDYVLFWTNDPPDPTAQEVRNAFTTSVQGIRDNAKATIFFAENIRLLCQAHLGVLATSPVAPLRGVVSLPAWGQRQDFGIPFQSDDVRTRLSSELRAHVASEDPSIPAVAIYGDTGVGKSRLVYEALNVDGVSERVLIGLGSQAVDPTLLSMVVQSSDRRLILVVDECSPDDRRQLTNYADLAQGRIRLITIGSRYSRDPQPPDRQFLELGPLETKASRDIALSAGVSTEQADQIAELTEGYPKLAYILARAITTGGPEAAIVQRIRGEAIGGVLSSMLDNSSDIEFLGILALFERIGYEAELAVETTAVCSSFEINESRFRIIVDRESGRFVSEAGRYRLVTPRLFAIWLATEYIRNHSNFSDALRSLPNSLRGRVIEQMKSFAGDAHVTAALVDVLGDAPFSTGVLEDVDEGSARLVHVAAIVEPQLGIKSIELILADHSTNDLLLLQHGRRRGIVEALEVLLWFDETFERAAIAILRLALAENERWANNATGLLAGIFGVYLGGTVVPFGRRVDWARSASRSYPAAIELLTSSLGKALDVHEMRGRTDLGTRATPAGWRPVDLHEEIDARRQALHLLLEIGQQDNFRESVGSVVAPHLRDLVTRGLLDDVLERVVTMEWSPIHRVQMNESLGHAIAYGQLSMPTRERIEEARARLIGLTPLSRLRYLLQVEPWLFDGHELDNDPRPVLEKVVDEVVSNGVAGIRAAAEEARNGNMYTAQILFEKIAAKVEGVDILHVLEAIHPRAEGAIIGCVRAAHKTWGVSDIVDTLTRWMQSDLARLVIPAAHVLPPSVPLAKLCIETVATGHAEGRELGRFLYGAWAKDLPQDVVSELVSAAGSSDSTSDLEAAIGIVSQWLDRHPDAVLSELLPVAMGLVRRSALVADQSSMLSLYREKVLPRLELPITERLRTLRDILHNLGGRLDNHDESIVEQMSEVAPEETINTVISVILGEGDIEDVKRSFRLQYSKVLSRVTAHASPETIRSCIDALSKDRLRELIAHIDFSTNSPSFLIEYLIETAEDDVVRARAAFAFIYPDNAWWGPESEYLRNQRPRVESWANAATRSTTRTWLIDVEAELLARIEVAVSREREE
jgi:hypothetical protein